eukprot:CAMPEP_0185201138 /NCGR_PEP_ID=MMETSP1140-20130426/48656_1 /TAXON_ID=298111 /ORGANISM="Pavlova sp., Strain CCMP459" /LENGTH=103 /DNA_ID=CAMNT_0027768517 /DNA_START=38 /DNA_END=346 /DNA_ORIENTATION=-
MLTTTAQGRADAHDGGFMMPCESFVVVSSVDFAPWVALAARKGGPRVMPRAESDISRTVSDTANRMMGNAGCGQPGSGPQGTGILHVAVALATGTADLLEGST